MSKRLPKATMSTLDDIQREKASFVEGRPALLPEGADARVFAEVVSEPANRPSTTPGMSEDDSPDKSLRRLRAEIIVERYTTYSALGGCIPLTLFDSLSVGVVIYNMVKSLADQYQTPWRPDQLKATLAALLGGILSPSIGNLATRLASAVIPGAWLVGTAASSAAAAACTRYVGEVFITHFESGGVTVDLDIARWRSYLGQRLARL